MMFLFFALFFFSVKGQIQYKGCAQGVIQKEKDYKSKKTYLRSSFFCLL